MDMSCICNFLNCTKIEVQNMYSCKSLHSEMLLQWSKLLEYDFLRIYSQHLILYSPSSSKDSNKVIKNSKKVLAQNKKNIYTIEIIHFILELIKKVKKLKFRSITSMEFLKQLYISGSISTKHENSSKLQKIYHGRHIRYIREPCEYHPMAVRGKAKNILYEYDLSSDRPVLSDEAVFPVF